ncbi:MAG: TonB-dependent siderophore receptor [Hyphomonadaceae bacterium]|nr:TonB-dependent siderophore receptor [Hyphomonadaceae bacterium]
MRGWVYGAAAMALAAGWGSAPAWAQSASPGAAASRETIVVTGQRRAPAVAATRLDADPLDVPQAIQSVSIATIEDQGFTRLGDAVRTISGVVRKEAYMGVTDSFAIRGFDAATGLYNGFRHDYYGGVIDLIHVDRVEVIKGPSSVSTGFLEPGGVVNVVTKRPGAEDQARLGASAGSFGRVRVEGDATWRVSDAIGLRFTGAAESAESFRDFVETERQTLGAALDWRLAPSTTLEASAIYFESESVPDRGLYIFSIGEVILDLPIERFFGEPSDFYTLDQTELTLVLHHAFNAAWSLRAGLEHGRTTDYRDNVQVTGLEPDGRTARRNYTTVPGSANTAAAFADLRGRFSTGPLAHQIVAGVDWGRQRQFYDFRSQDVFQPIDIFDPVYGGVKGAPVSCCRFVGVTESVGVYAQDLISLGERWKLLIGVRHDAYDYRDDDAVALTRTTFSQEETTPRIGLVYRPGAAWSIYGNVARSFNPQPFTRLSNGETPDPSAGEQVEVGVRYAALDGRLSASFAVFEITKTNVATTDPSNPDFQILSGEQRSRGAEIDLNARPIDGLNLIASYAYIDAEVTADNDLPVGDALVNVPQHQASLWLRYDAATLPIGVGFGAYHVGEREATLPNTFIIPGYTRLDAALFWRVQDGVEAALNVQNLTDETYYDSQDNLLYPGAPLSVLASVRVKL